MWSHFQVQGHIFGQVVTLYQICCTKTPRRRLFTPSFFFYRTQAHIRTAHKQAPEIPVPVFCLSTPKAH